MRALLLIAAFAAALAAPPANAQQAFDKRINYWRVSGGGTICVAANRPFHEIDAAPFHALTITHGKEGRWTFSFFFWPKALKADADIPLVFTFGGRKDVKALGKAFGEIGVVMAN